MASRRNLVLDYFGMARPGRASHPAKPILYAILILCIAGLLVLASIHTMPEERYRPIVETYASKLDMDVDLVLAVIGIESRGRPNAVSPKGAMGLMQLMPGTAAAMAEKENISLSGNTDLFVPEINIRLGIRYLFRLLKRYNGDVILALGAYNAGPGRIAQWRKEHPSLGSRELCAEVFFKETRHYVSAVLRRKDTLLRARGESR